MEPLTFNPDAHQEPSEVIPSVLISTCRGRQWTCPGTYALLGLIICFIKTYDFNIIVCFLPRV